MEVENTTAEVAAVEAPAEAAAPKQRPLLSSVVAFRELRDTAPVRVEVPEWDCDVLIKKFNGRDRQAFLDYQKDEKNKDRLFLHVLLAFALVNEAGERILSDDEVDLLFERDPVVVERLAFDAAETNGLLLQTVEAAAKNSVRTESSEPGTN